MACVTLHAAHAHYAASSLPRGTHAHLVARRLHASCCQVDEEMRCLLANLKAMVAAEAAAKLGEACTEACIDERLQAQPATCGVMYITRRAC